jgi:hypothetical protein
MAVEQGEKQKIFLHHPGELFILKDPKSPNGTGQPEYLVHVVGAVGEAFDPHIDGLEDYFAPCGAWSKSWSPPAANIEWPVFVRTEADIEKKKAKLCETCFPEHAKQSGI